MDTIELSRSAAVRPAPAFPPFAARAPWWGGDLQTLRNFFVRRHGRLDAYPAERLSLAMDDGSGDVLLAVLNRPLSAPAARPLVVLVHGLTGCEESFYLRNTAAHLLTLGFPVLRLNQRGAGPSRPFCRFQYHAGRSEDFAAVLARLPPVLTAAGVVAIGYSLGANMLLKYLGEHGSAAAVRAAVSVSAPLDLADTSRWFLRARNVFYQNYLLREMKREAVAPGAELSAGERAAIAGARSIWAFDHGFSAPRNGFAGAEEYYARNASRRFLDGIAVPTLVIHALDDPWIPADAYLAHEWRRNPSLVPLLSRQGGHVGFLGRDHRVAWHDLCIERFLASV
ncbi:MAG: YheT family hydrolase [Stellaceae bacterium]